MTLREAKRAAARTARRLRCRCAVVDDGGTFAAVFCPSIKRPWARVVGHVDAEGNWRESAREG